MNLRDLEYLVAVSETLHFRRAAEQCFVSQPTLSGQISKLETEIGVSLLERTNKSVKVTPIGQKVIGHARQILEQTEAIRNLAQAHLDPLSGPLRIGAIHTLSPYLVPLFLLDLQQQHPELSLELTEETTDKLIDKLKSHQLDAILLATSPNSEDLVSMPLFLEPFWLAHSRDHNLYEKDEIYLDDLSKENVLLLTKEHCLSDQVIEACHIKMTKESNPMPSLNAASLETLVQLVGMDLGVTLVPALSVHGGRLAIDKVILREVKIKNAVRQIRLVFRASFPRKSALDLLANIICNVLPNTVQKSRRI